MQKYWSILFGATMLGALLLFVIAPFIPGWWLPRNVATFGLDHTVVLVGPLPSAIGFPCVRSDLCRRARRNLTRAEWNEFLPSHPYQRTCPSF